MLRRKDSLMRTMTIEEKNLLTGPSFTPGPVTFCSYAVFFYNYTWL